MPVFWTVTVLSLDVVVDDYSCAFAFIAGLVISPSSNPAKAAVAIIALTNAILVVLILNMDFRFGEEIFIEVKLFS